MLEPSACLMVYLRAKLFPFHKDKAMYFALTFVQETHLQCFGLQLCLSSRNMKTVRK